MSNEKDVEKKVEEAAKKVEETAEKAKAKAEEKADKAKKTVEAAKGKAAGDAKEAADKAKKTAKAAKDKTEGAAKAAGKDVAAVKKGMSKKNVAIIAIAICVVAAIALILMMNKGGGDTSSYAKISDYDKYVKLGKYKGLEYTEEKVKVTDKEVKDEIKTRRQEKAETKDVKKGTVKDGDNVNISFVGTIKGKKFDGGTADNQTLTIGSGTMIPGFEDGLIGKKVGSKVTLNLRFPKDYGYTEKNGKKKVSNKDQAKLAGKKVKFKVTINSKQVTKTPKYNKAFIMANSDYTNKKDYEASVKKELMASKEETAKQTAMQTVWSQAVENAEIIKYPEGVVDEEKDAMIEQYKKQAESYGMKWKDFLKMMSGTGKQMTEKEFEKQMKTYGENVAKQRLVSYSIADKEGVKVTDKEYKEFLNDQLKQANYTKETFKESMGMTIEEFADQNNWRESLLSQKVMELVFKEGKAKKASK